MIDESYLKSLFEKWVVVVVVVVICHDYMALFKKKLITD